MPLLTEDDVDSSSDGAHSDVSLQEEEAPPQRTYKQWMDLGAGALSIDLKSDQMAI